MKPVTLDLLRRSIRIDDVSASSDFDLNPEVRKFLPPDRVLRPAAVLIPIVERSAGLTVLLTKRASHLKHHPGQIAFPGGKVDASDADPRAAALREAEEEIGLPRDQVETLGALPAHETVTSFTVTPFIGLIPSDFRATPEPGEVEEVFEVPLDFLADPQNMRVHGRIWKGQMRHYYAVPYGPYYIWGATARMVHGFADRIARCV